jgi:hypothetical protein
MDHKFVYGFDEDGHTIATSPFGLAGARGAEGTRGVGSESLPKEAED